MTTMIDFALLIDDDSVDNELHRRVLRKSGLVDEVVCFTYADEALGFLQVTEKRPNLIFLDINMPRMDGFEFLKEYETIPEEKKANCVIMMLTTSTNPQDAERAAQINSAIELHSKPLKTETVVSIAEKYFSQQ